MFSSCKKDFGGTKCLILEKSKDFKQNLNKHFWR